jgi:hypothetical protein
MLFTVTISSLEDVEFIVEDGKIEVVDKKQESNDTKSDDDIIGKVFGMLTAIKPIGKVVNTYKIWLFQCSCGNATEAALSQVKRGQIKSCGCLRFKFKNIAGQRFGNLTAIKRLETKNNFGKYLWECRCDCGKTRTATVEVYK